MTSCLALTFHGIRARHDPGCAILDPAAARYYVSTRRLDRTLDKLDPLLSCTVSEFLQKSSGHWLILTFDDGLATDYELVLPRLVRRRLRGTFFVTAENVDCRGFTSTAQLRTMVELGMEIGSHGLTHEYLVTMPRRSAIRQIRESKTRLEQALGVEVASFAPVGGHFRRWMRAAAAEAGYRTFATMMPGRSACGSRLTVLRRNHIQAQHDDAYVEHLLSGNRLTLLPSRVRYCLLGVPKRLLGLRNYDRLKRWALAAGDA